MESDMEDRGNYSNDIMEVGEDVGIFWPEH